MKCNYRNCNAEVNDRRSQAKYCCNNCRWMERLYLRRIRSYQKFFRIRELTPEQIEHLKKLRPLK
jgi:hypothetical protein